MFQLCDLVDRVTSISSLQLSFSVLIGPINHLKHLFSKDRLPFSVVYFSSLGLTLYFSLGVSFRVAYVTERF